jgi:hypothetical protein
MDGATRLGLVLEGPDGGRLPLGDDWGIQGIACAPNSTRHPG